MLDPPCAMFALCMHAVSVCVCCLHPCLHPSPAALPQAQRAYQVVLGSYGNNPKLVYLYGKFLQTVKNDPWRAVRTYAARCRFIMHPCTYPRTFNYLQLLGAGYGAALCRLKGEQGTGSYWVLCPWSIDSMLTTVSTKAYPGMTCKPGLHSPFELRRARRPSGSPGTRTVLENW
jgi:hypothetical protein